MLRVGAFKNKIDLGETIRMNDKALIAFSLILKIGALKYPSFSWYNNFQNPSADSTVKCHFTALLRHFTAHRMGYTVDPDSKLPHVFHMCCRACMLVSSYYLESNINYKVLTNLTNHKDDLTACDIGKDITGEIVLSLSKTKNVIKSSSASELETLISDLLIEAVSLNYHIPKTKDAFADISLPDLLLKACSLYLNTIINDTTFVSEYKTFIKQLEDFYPNCQPIHEDLACLLGR